EKDELTRFTVKSMELGESVQNMVFMFDNLKENAAEIWLMWDKTAIKMDVSVEVDSKVEKAIAEVMAGPSANDYYNAAGYHLSKGKDLEAALGYMDKAMEKGGNERFWMVTRRAQVLAALKKKDEAIKTAEMGMEMAKKANNAAFVKMNETVISEMKGM
ncbi:MAG: hypothetical protein AAF206_29010, partial [Bacteroidota bacterium]